MNQPIPAAPATQSRSLRIARSIALVVLAFVAGVVLFVVIAVKTQPDKNAEALAAAAAASAAAAVPVAEPPPPPPPPPRRHYALQDGWRYGYEPALTEAQKAAGLLAPKVLMVAYNGLREGRHQIMELDDAMMRSVAPPLVRTFEWAPGEEFVKISVFRGGKFAEKDFIRANPKALVMEMMRDAQNGYLERYVHQAKNGKHFVFCDEKAGCGSEALK